METMRYQENKKSSKWPIIAFTLFVVIGGALIYLGIANENNPEIVGSVREEVQNLVDIYSEETMSTIENTKINIEEIEFTIEDETFVDNENNKFKADIVLPKIYIEDDELTSINEEIKSKYVDLFTSLKNEMTSVENKFTFKTSYKYYDNIVSDKRILSITVHQRIVDDVEGKTTTDKVETYNIDLENKDIIDESTIAINIFGKDYKTIIKNKVKAYAVENNMISEDNFVYSLTGLENYYIKDGVFHIIFNESELVDEKFGVLDIEIEKDNLNKDITDKEEE